MLAGVVALLLLGITNQAWLPAAGCLLLLVLLLIRIRSAKAPFIQPSLLLNKGYSLGLVIAFLAMGIGYSLPFLSPQLLTYVNRLEPGGGLRFSSSCRHDGAVRAQRRQTGG